MVAPDGRPLRSGPLGGDGSSALLPDDVPTQEVQRIDLEAAVEPDAPADAERVADREPARDGVSDVGASTTTGIPAPQTSSPAVSTIPAAADGIEQDGATPFPGAVHAKADGRSPNKSYRVKGNSRSKLYHTMQSPYYERTKATVWFRSAAEAEEAGFAPWNWRAHHDN